MGGVSGLKARSRIRLALVLAAAVAPACSLFIPFDDYAGSARADADAGSDGDASQASDGSPPGDVDAGAGDASECDADVRSDPANCGACGRSCGAGATCESGRCPIELVVTSDAGEIGAIHIDPDPRAQDPPPYLYFTTRGGAVGRMVPDSADAGVQYTPAPGAVGPLSVRSSAASGVVAMDGGIAFFRAQTFVDEGLHPLVEGWAGGPVVHEQSNVFFAVPSGVSWRSVNVTPPDAATYGQAATAAPVAFALSRPTRVLWASVDGTTYVMSADAPTSSPAVLLDGGWPDTISLAATATHVYVGQKSQGVRIFDWDQIASTATYSQVTVVLDDPAVVVADPRYLYVLELRATDRGELHRVPGDGSTKPIQIASMVAPARTLAISGDYVYFADGESVYRTIR
jgi:hypothetical protein